MENAVTLANWYVMEACRLQEAARTDPRLRRAQVLLDWLQGRPERQTSFRDIIKFGPANLRTKDAADDALTILAKHGWVEEASKRPRLILLREEDQP
jgi:hypothetical protein